MAYIVNPDLQKDPNEVENLTGPKLLTGAPGSDGGTNSLTATSANPLSSSSAYTPANNAASASGSFTNLKQYLDTNQPQATQLGQNLGGQITQKANDATSAIGNVATQFRDQVDQNTIKLDPTLQNKAINDSANFVNSADYDKFAKILAGQYAGPTSLDKTDLYTDVNKKVTDATTAGQLGETAGGRIELLRQLPGATPYARGGLSLDQMLVQNTDPARQAVEQGVAATKPVADAFSTAQTGLTQAATDAVTKSQQAAQQAKDGLVGAQHSLRDQLNARVTQQQQQAAAQQAAIQAALANGSIAPDQLAALGITQDQFNNLTSLQQQAKSLGGAGVNLQDYFHANNPAQIGVANVVTPDEIARYQALQKMAGTTDTSIPGAVESPVNLMSFDPTTAITTLNGQIEAAKSRQAADAANQTAMQQAQSNADRANKTGEAISTVGGAIAGAQIGAALSDGVGAVVGGIAGAIFCFVKGTPMLMADGSVKNVEDIDIGDDMALGGTVFAAGKAVETQIYKYHGVYVASTHTVFGEDGVWRKVADCAEAEKVELEGGVIVCPIVNENHLMVTGDFISADFAEVDNPGWDMNGKQRLDYLNMWTERNEQLLNVLKSVFPHKYQNENTEIQE